MIRKLQTNISAETKFLSWYSKIISQLKTPLFSTVLTVPSLETISYWLIMFLGRKAASEQKTHLTEFFTVPKEGYQKFCNLSKREKLYKNGKSEAFLTTNKRFKESSELW